MPLPASRRHRLAGLGIVLAAALLCLASVSAALGPIGAPALVRDINPGVFDGIYTGSSAIEMIAIGDTLYFAGNTNEAGLELWKSDGTEAGTVLVKDIHAGVDPSWPTEFVDYEGQLLFVADDGVHGNEIWKSDGTEVGTVMVKEIHPTDGAEPQHLTISGDSVYFVANDGVHAYELWKTDGTEGGTVMVKDIDPTTNGLPDWPYTYQVELTDVNGTLFFAQYNNNYYDWDLWKSDGTEGGTVLVKDLYGVFGTDLALCNVDGVLFFSGSTLGGSAGQELWKSDGTTGGTVMVKDIKPGLDAGSGPALLTDVDGTLFFRADDGPHSWELWKSDGTEGGTVMVKDINPTGSSFAYMCTNPPCIAAVGQRLFFTAYDDAYGAELWVSDGTEGGTQRVKDANPGWGSYEAGEITPVGDQAFFVYASATSAGNLWLSDGTESGTVMIEAYEQWPQLLTVMGKSLYYAAGDAPHGNELWSLLWNITYDHSYYLPVLRRP